MRRTVLIEGILVLVISLGSMVEGLRLIAQRDPRTAFDVMGPGSYILFLSITLMAAGVVYFTVNYKKNLRMEKVAVNKEMRIRVISMIVVLVIYILLIGIVGYLVASIVFLLMEFRIAGVKSWSITIILSLVLSATFYMVFVQFANILFP